LEISISINFSIPRYDIVTVAPCITFAISGFYPGGRGFASGGGGFYRASLIQFVSSYTVSQKGDTIPLTISSPNIGQL